MRSAADRGEGVELSPDEAEAVVTVLAGAMSVVYELEATIRAFLDDIDGVYHYPPNTPLRDTSRGEERN
jgi:hypothetical protein